MADADVPEMLAWADRTARSTGRTHGVMLEVHDAQQGPGLVRLCGWDVNAASDATGSSRPAYALARPVEQVGLAPLPGGMRATGAFRLADRVVIATVSNAQDDLAAALQWRVTDDVGTEYSFLGAGSGGGADGVSSVLRAARRTEARKAGVTEAAKVVHLRVVGS